MTLGYLAVKSKGSAGRKETQVSHTDPEWGLSVDAETPNTALVNVSKSGRVVSKLLVPEFAQALKMSAKKPFFWGSLAKACAQYWFHPEAAASLAKWNSLKPLQSF